MTTIIIIIAVITAFAIFYYNKLIRRKNEVDNATGSISVMLKNRYDLIPNLVETVKRYMTHETDTLNKLTSMRTIALEQNNTDKFKNQLDADIANSMKKIMLSVENYPDLKASTNFIQLQESWTDIEDRISASRRFYNNAVTEYNITINSFPENIIAKMMGYKPKMVFEVTAEEAQNLKAKDLYNN